MKRRFERPWIVLQSCKYFFVSTGRALQTTTTASSSASTSAASLNGVALAIGAASSSATSQASSAIAVQVCVPSSSLPTRPKPIPALTAAGRGCAALTRCLKGLRHLRGIVWSLSSSACLPFKLILNDAIAATVVPNECTTAQMPWIAKDSLH